MKKALLLISISLCALIAAGCATVEYTNRKSFIIISPEEEKALGEESFRQVRAEYRASGDKGSSELLKNVGLRISQAADKPEYRWEFVLFDAPETVNAFALPGGKVAFFSGILPLCEGEGGIAVVMGHEIAHVIARHGAERMSQGIVAELAGEVLSVAVRNRTPAAQRAILNGYGFTATVGVLLPFSRKHEYEADYIGMIIMAKAGYDPHEAVRFWERMLAHSKGESPPEFLSTHPNDEARIRELKTRLPEALAYYTKSP